MNGTPLSPAGAQRSTAGWLRLAVAAQVLMMAYFIIDNYLPLYPWNNLPAAGNQIPSTLMGVIPFSIFTLVFLLQARSRRVREPGDVGVSWVRLGMIIGSVWAWVWLALQAWQWWIPYLFGPTLVHSDFSWYVEHGYAQTLRILPVIEGRPAPDLQHLTLELLSLTTALVMTVATMRTRTGATRR